MKRLLTFSILMGLAAQCAFAGNDSKRGSAGATELLINPWARSTGWNGANTGNVRGLEAMNLNIGGLAFVNQTDFMLCTQRYLSGSGITVNSLGFAQKLSPTGVLGITLTNLSLGNDMYEATYTNPEQNTTISPQFFNFGVSYAKKFSSRISGGILVRGIYEGIANVSAFGVTFDGGIQYQGGQNDAFKFGVALRNVGPKMNYSGEGLSFKGQRDQIGLTIENRTSAFEMPALLNIGTSYDLYVGPKSGEVKDVRITPAFTFTSNSYTSDNLIPGLELGFREMFMLRASYAFKNDFLKSDAVRTDAYTGLAAGATIEMPINELLGAGEAADVTSSPFSSGNMATPDAPVSEEESAPVTRKASNLRIGIDYSYRATNPYAGTHAIGIVLKF